MQQRPTQRMSHAVVTAVVTMLLAFGPNVALAAPPANAAPAGSKLEAKKAERAAALAELQLMEADLASKVEDYVELSRQMGRAREKADEISAELLVMDAQLIEKKRALSDRAIQLYRTDQIGMLELLLASESMSQLMDRMSYLVASARSDSSLIRDVQLAQQEGLWLQEALDMQITRLSEMQVDAENQASRIESDMAAQQVKATELGEDIARLMREQRSSRVFAGSDPSGEFLPDLIISDDNFTDSAAMTAEDIQKFLDDQPGSLKSYRAPDHSGKVKTAAQMIAEAATQWHVSPMVILVTLQKEQSLIGRSNPPQKALDWAMGCGRADSRTYYEYQGFGNQIWWGAQKLDKNSKPWHQGIQMKIDGNGVSPQNKATYSLYKYTPHLHGTMSFWLLYWRYFGDPLAPPSETVTPAQ